MHLHLVALEVLEPQLHLALAQLIGCILVLGYHLGLGVPLLLLLQEDGDVDVLELFILDV